MSTLTWASSIPIHAAASAKARLNAASAFRTAARRSLCDFDSSIAKRLGVMPGFPQSLADLPGFGDRCVNCEHGFPGARCLAEQLFTLPTHGRLTVTDTRRLKQWLLQVEDMV